MNTVSIQSQTERFDRCCLFTAMCLLCLGGLSTSSFGDDLLKVHEWGTFTSFQDERGTAFSRINTDDEPVPKFVHRLFYPGDFSPTNMPPQEAKGVKYGMPSITMRLETPVTYFHLPPTVSEMTLDMSSQFRGGWLTEFYPQAIAQVDGQTVTDCKKVNLESTTIGQLTWNGIRLREVGQGPATEDRVWLAPRQVNAAQVTVGDESERFLFYRGVGRVDAPLRVVRPSESNRLEIRGPLTTSPELTGLKVPHSWLAEITPDAKTAFRPIDELVLTGQPDQLLAETVGQFADAEFSIDNLEKLRSDMQTALIEQGLFADEAAALLSTWELSYFQSPGLRMFFLVPDAWTAAVLPLKLSVPAEVTRVMVGRIELVTPRQRQLLKNLAVQPLADLREVSAALNTLRTSSSAVDREKYNALASGCGDIDHLGIPVPECYQTFLDLGRFRTSLLLSAAWQGGRSNRALSEFAGEVQAPGFGVQRSLEEKRKRDEEENLRRKSLERQIMKIEQQESRQRSPTDAVMFLGDSLFNRWDMKNWFPTQTIICHGFNRIATSDLKDLTPRIVIPCRPSLIIIQMGIDEIARDVSAQQFLANYQTFVATVHDHLPQTRIAFTAIRPSPLHQADFQIQTEANQLIREFCRGDDRLIYVDVVTPMLGPLGKPRPELFEEKSPYFNQQGIELWAKFLNPIIRDTTAAQRAEK